VSVLGTLFIARISALLFLAHYPVTIWGRRRSFAPCLVLFRQLERGLSQYTFFQFNGSIPPWSRFFFRPYTDLLWFTPNLFPLGRFRATPCGRTGPSGNAANFSSPYPPFVQVTENDSESFSALQLFSLIHPRIPGSEPFPSYGGSTDLSWTCGPDQFLAREAVPAGLLPPTSPCLFSPPI